MKRGPYLCLKARAPGLRSDRFGATEITAQPHATSASAERGSPKDEGKRELEAAARASPSRVQYEGSGRQEIFGHRAGFSSQRMDADDP